MNMQQRNPFRRRQGSDVTTMADRRGVRGDIDAGYDEKRPLHKDPQVDKPGFMISNLRYAGATEGSAPADAMTSKAHALYEYLMASARPTLATQTEWQVPYSAARAYLDVPRSDRVTEYLDDIGQTYIQYDYTDRDGNRCYGRMQLLQCDTVERTSGERSIRFSMHPGVRTLMLNSTQYTWIELAAFPRFRCRYTARLYPIFALRAGMDAEFKDPLAFDPEELARRIGWPKTGADFHFGHFESRALKPALEDVAAYVKAFDVRYEVTRSAARGRPVAAVLFRVSQRKRDLEECQLAPMTQTDRTNLRRHAKSMGIDPVADMPGETALRKAATLRSKSVSEVAAGWADALVNDNMRERTDAFGATEAFAQRTRWLTDVEYDFPEIVKPAPATFEDADVIRVEFSDDLNSKYIVSEVLPVFKEPLYSDPKIAPLRKLRLEWWDNGVARSRELEVPLVKQSFGHFHGRFKMDIDTIEYIRLQN